MPPAVYNVRRLKELPIPNLNAGDDILNEPDANPIAMTQRANLANEPLRLDNERSLEELPMPIENNELPSFAEVLIELSMPNLNTGGDERDEVDIQNEPDANHAPITQRALLANNGPPGLGNEQSLAELPMPIENVELPSFAFGLDS